MSKRYNLQDLIDMMATLRNPENGCPWDVKQDFKSIAPYTIEEAYEVADAIERNNMHDLKEELGDLLFQSIYHAQMASEKELFTIDDVIHDITAKMISRHPHVFGDKKAISVADVDKIWEERKSAEKAQSQSVLDGVTLGLPALLRAQKLQKKAAKVGFEWRSINDVYAKIDEEIEEFKEALELGNPEHIEDELGDLLLNVVNLARMQGINAEQALHKANRKFESRFKGIENDLKNINIDIKDATLDQMTQSWQDQKAKERRKT